MNTRQGVLVTLFFSSAFMNFASIYWAMWSVLTTSFFVIMTVDFMFFEVRAPSTPAVAAAARRALILASRCGWRLLRRVPRWWRCSLWRPTALSQRRALAGCFAWMSCELAPEG